MREYGCDRSTRADPQSSDEPSTAPEQQPQQAQEELPTPQLTESQHRRLTTPMFGMLMTMGVLVLLMGGFYFLSPEPDYTYIPDEDVRSEAAALHAADVTGYAPLAPMSRRTGRPTTPAGRPGLSMGWTCGRRATPPRP